MQARVDVVIVTYQSAGTIEAAIASVAPSPGVTAVVVVDNASPDGSARVARQAGAPTVLRNADNLGFAAAVNRGLAECHSEYVLLLNPDATIDAASLELLAGALDGDPAAVLAGPILVTGGARVEASAPAVSRRPPTVCSGICRCPGVPGGRRPSTSTPPHWRHGRIHCRWTICGGRRC